VIEDCQQADSPRASPRSACGCVFSWCRGGTVVGVLCQLGHPLQESTERDPRVGCSRRAGRDRRGDLLHQPTSSPGAMRSQAQNRRVWDEELTREIARADRTDAPLIAVIDTIVTVQRSRGTRRATTCSSRPRTSGRRRPHRRPARHWRRVRAARPTATSPGLGHHRPPAELVRGSPTCSAGIGSCAPERMRRRCFADSALPRQARGPKPCRAAAA
jgi:hypothetical protein